MESENSITKANEGNNSNKSNENQPYSIDSKLIISEGAYHHNFSTKEDLRNGLKNGMQYSNINLASDVIIISYQSDDDIKIVDANDLSGVNFDQELTLYLCSKIKNEKYFEFFEKCIIKKKVNDSAKQLLNELKGTNDAINKLKKINLIFSDTQKKWECWDIILKFFKDYFKKANGGIKVGKKYKDNNLKTLDNVIKELMYLEERKNKIKSEFEKKLFNTIYDLEKCKKDENTIKQLNTKIKPKEEKIQDLYSSLENEINKNPFPISHLTEDKKNCWHLVKELKQNPEQNEENDKKVMSIVDIYTTLNDKWREYISKGYSMYNDLKLSREEFKKILEDNKKKFEELLKLLTGNLYINCCSERIRRLKFLQKYKKTIENLNSDIINEKNAQINFEKNHSVSEQISQILSTPVPDIMPTVSEEIIKFLKENNITDINDNYNDTHKRTYKNTKRYDQSIEKNNKIVIDIKEWFSKIQNNYNNSKAYSLPFEKFSGITNTMFNHFTEVGLSKDKKIKELEELNRKIFGNTQKYNKPLNLKKSSSHFEILSPSKQIITNGSNKPPINMNSSNEYEDFPKKLVGNYINYDEVINDQRNIFILNSENLFIPLGSNMGDRESKNIYFGDKKCIPSTKKDYKIIAIIGIIKLDMNNNDDKNENARKPIEGKKGEAYIGHSNSKNETNIAGYCQNNNNELDPI